MNGSMMPASSLLPRTAYDAKGASLAFGSWLANQAIVETVETVHHAATLAEQCVTAASTMAQTLVPAGRARDALDVILTLQREFARIAQRSASAWGRRFGHMAFGFPY
jgi:hypothetical protein